VPSRLRLPAALLACLAVTGLVSAVLWRHESASVQQSARANARAAAAAIEERAAAATLAVQGLRSAYDSGPVEQAAFVRLARLPLARPEVVAVGWAPRVPAAERAALEAAEQIRIGAPADAVATYPLLLREPALAGNDVPDLGSDPTLGPALRLARTNGEPALSAPARLAGDGRIGAYVFVPVYAPGLPVATPGERRDALRGVVVGALATDVLVGEATSGLAHGAAVRLMEGAAVLGGAPVRSGARAEASVGGRTWTVAVAQGSPSRFASLAAALVGGALALLLGLFHRRLARLSAAGRKLQTTLVRERRRAQQKLRAVEERVGETERAVALIADAASAVVLDIDGDGNIVSCSAEAQRLLGYEPAELVGSTIYELLHPDDLLSPPSGPHRYRRRDGTFVILETSRLTRRDALGFTSDVVTILREPGPDALLRTAAQRIADAVALEPDPIELFSIVTEEVAAELKVPAVSLVRFEGGFGTVVGACAESADADWVTGATIDLDQTTPAGLVFADGKPAAGAAPLRVGARLWGALVAEGADTAALVELAELVHGAVAYADATARLSALTTRDQLTNLPDHRAFQEQLRAEVRRAERHERALALVLVNLDGFRRLNEEHGRLAADRVLAEVARRLGSTVRAGEVVSRLGADHFAWLLPETEGLNGWIAAERARRAISSVPFDGVGIVTASAGVCDLEEVGGPEELLGLAEVAVVHAKASGGDATFRYSDELDAEVAAGREDREGLERLRALARKLDAGEPGTEGHSDRVALLAEKLAVAAGWEPESAVRLSQAAYVHDVGKLGIDEQVLRKSGPLDADELEQIRSHPETSAEIAIDALDPEQLSWVRHHHERWDGAGYPSRLTAHAIPAGAQLLALAEAWDSMTSSRLYGAALSVGDALAECRRETGSQFAPDAVAALERLWTLGALDAADARAAAE
jgi:diguanylate cyclase (GGDEF)-like protein